MANDDGRPATLEVLRALSETNLLYAELHLHRARVLLPALSTRDEHLDLRREREDLRCVTGELRERGDWSRVRRLADGAAGKKGRLAAKDGVLEVAHAVYAPRIPPAGATALALNGAVQRDYDASRIMAMFCVLRRQRFLIEDRLDLGSSGVTR